jgi:hypothetical protein
MMKITQIQETFEGFDQFKISGSIDFGNYEKGAKVIVNAIGERKSESIEKLVEQIDILIKYLENSKKTLGGI